MYDELVKSLRICEGACNKECVLYNSVQVDGDTCQNRLCAMAADAIEKLSKYADAIRKLKHEGWYLQGIKYHDGYNAIATMPLPEPPKEGDV